MLQTTKDRGGKSVRTEFLLFFCRMEFFAMNGGKEKLKKLLLWKSQISVSRGKRKSRTSCIKIRMDTLNQLEI